MKVKLKKDSKKLMPKTQLKVKTNLKAGFRWESLWDWIPTLKNSVEDETDVKADG